MTYPDITQLFPVGQLVATPGALAMMTENLLNPMDYLARHLSGDWGDMSKDDKMANDQALKYEGERIFSSYNTAGGKIWIITEADRSSTCILLPEEY